MIEWFKFALPPKHILDVWNLTGVQEFWNFFDQQILTRIAEKDNRTQCPQELCERQKMLSAHQVSRAHRVSTYLGDDDGGSDR